MTESSAPPVGAAPSSPPPVRLIAPPLPRRLACWLYEGMLMFAVTFVAAWLFSTLSQMRDAMDPRRSLFQGFLFVVFGIYFTWFWSRGQTLAMKTWRIRIVDASGGPVSQTRALLRYALAWVWFLPSALLAHALHLPPPEIAVLMIGWVAIWAILARFHPDRQFWHDVWAGTRLIDSPPPSSRKR